MNRLAAVKSQLQDHFSEMRHNVYVAETNEEWIELAITISDNLEAVGETAYGWSLPYHDDQSATRLSMLLYPQRVVQISEHLDDEHFSHFLDAVEFRLNLKFAWFGEDRFYDVDAVLAEESADSLNLLNTVQLKVLDAV